MMKLRVGFFVGCCALAAAGCTDSEPLAPPIDFQADRSVSDTTSGNVDGFGASTEDVEADSTSIEGIGGFGSGN